MKQKPSILIQIVHIQGPLRGDIQEFDGTRLTIGRHPSCDVVFPKEQTLISRHHAVISREGNTFSILDESANGTFVNGQRIREAQLKSGDVITIGEGGPKISFLTQVGQKATPSSAAKVRQVPPVETKPAPPPSPQSPLSNSASPWDSIPKDENRPSPPAEPSLWQSSASGAPPRPAASSMPKANPPQVVAAQQPLVIQYGPRLETFRSLPVTMGRGGDCEFTIDQGDLSEHHAQVFFYQDQYWIKDLSGRGQILINGRAINDQAPLQPQAQLSLSPQGPHFTFLGGGRLAEIAQPLASEVDAAPAVESQHNHDKDGRARKFSGFMRRLSKKE